MPRARLLRCDHVAPTIDRLAAESPFTRTELLLALANVAYRDRRREVLEVAHGLEGAVAIATARGGRARVLEEALERIQEPLEAVWPLGLAKLDRDGALGLEDLDLHGG